MDFSLCFVPRFVAVDAVGVLPTFLSPSQGMEANRVRRVIHQSKATAAAVALAFLALGTAILDLLGITVADFMVAGGILLFVLAMGDLLAIEKPQRQIDPDSPGAVDFLSCCMPGRWPHARQEWPEMAKRNSCMCWNSTPAKTATRQRFGNAGWKCFPTPRTRWPR